MNNATFPNLARLLSPKTIAVVGANEKLGMSNNSVLPMLEAGRQVVLVNPSRETLYGQPALPNLSAFGGPVDAVLSLVNAERSLDVLEEAAVLGCGADRLPDLVALRQAIYSLPNMVETMEITLVLQDPEIRDRNLILEDQWRQITAPTLSIASGQDYSEYANTSRRVAELIPNCELLEMPGVKHWPHFEDADVFNAAAIKFLLG